MVDYTLVDQIEPERVGLERLLIVEREKWDDDDFTIPRELPDGIHIFLTSDME